MPSLPPFERAVELHGRAVLSFCVARLGYQRGEDCFQETMLAALGAYTQLNDAEAIRSWLFSIASRKAIDSYRKEQAHRTEKLNSYDSSSDDKQSALLENQALWQQVRELPEKQQQAVTLRYLADLSYAEIAAVMQSSEEAARRNVFEGLNRLRKEVKDDE